MHHTIHPDLTFYCLEKQNFSCFSDFAGYLARFIPQGKMARPPGRGAISLNPAAGAAAEPLKREAPPEPFSPAGAGRSA